MFLRKGLVVGLVCALAATLAVSAQTIIQDEGNRWRAVSRTTLAIKYPEDKDSNINLVGTPLYPRAAGRAEVKRKNGRTRIQLRLENIENPQKLGSFFTTYVIWAVTPEGQADNLGELPINKEMTKETEVTTPHQNFGLIVTAEPHGLVKYPSPTIIAENVLRKDTKGEFTAGQVEYRGDSGLFYVLTKSAPNLDADLQTPLTVLGARRAVQIAQRAGAERFAASELAEAEKKLATLEQIWPSRKDDSEKFSGEARDVMRLAEAARAATVERVEQARLDAERRAAGQAISQSRNEAASARSDAATARGEAARAQEALTRSEAELAQARQRVEQAASEADKAKAREELARLEAARANLEKEQVKRERDEAQQRLFVSLSEILETRREARGLIVNLSDVLFDFNQTTLKPGAKEKLSKLAGILIAYPGNYRMEIEGHTDAVGTDDYNSKLSQGRANAVREYLTQAGVKTDRILATRGLGETRPVATNDTAEGRQMNRRVELIIADAEGQAASNR